MSKTACVIMGFAFLALGILGITGLVPMFRSDPIYVNIGQIVLGGLGLLVGIYARQGNRYDQQARNFSQQTKSTAVRQQQENDQLRKENEQGKQANLDRQQQENEQLKKVNEQQRRENEQLQKHNDHQN